MEQLLCLYFYKNSWGNLLGFPLDLWFITRYYLFFLKNESYDSIISLGKRMDYMGMIHFIEF